MKLLKLFKMGCDFRTDESRAKKSNCQNYRLRAENINTENGEKVGADFGFMGDFNDLRIEAWQEIQQSGTKIFSAFPLLENQAYGKNYTTADILNAVNAVSVEQFDGVQIIER